MVQALCSKPPYLPRASDPQQLQHPEAALLDRTFRLLREDMCGPARRQLHDLGVVEPQPDDAQGQDPQRQPAAASMRHVYPRVSAARACCSATMPLAVGHSVGW
jgi:hypothetical protein